jgi:ABC-type multidrug transport system fused ATPase/permease subunit
MNTNPEFPYIFLNESIHHNPNNADDVVMDTIEPIIIPDKKEEKEKIIDIAKSITEALLVYQTLIRIIVLFIFLPIFFVIYLLFKNNIELVVIFIIIYIFIYICIYYMSNISDNIKRLDNILTLKIKMRNPIYHLTYQYSQLESQNRIERIQNSELSDLIVLSNSV